MTKVYVAIPSYDWRPKSEVLINIFQQELPPDTEIILQRENILDGLPVQLARNQLLFNFLRKSDAEYLWFCDDDNPPDITTLKYLLEHKVDAISAIVPLRKWNLRYCVVKNWKPIESFEWLGWPLIECDNIGTWCCLLSRKLCEDVRKLTEWHPFQFRVSDYVLNEITGKPEEYENQDFKEWWAKIYRMKDWKIYKVKRMIWEDLRFFEQAQKLWYKCYADLRAHCYHFMGSDEKRRVKNEDFIIAQSFIQKQNDDKPIDYSADIETGDFLWWSDGESEGIEVTLLWSDNDWGQIS